MALLVDDLETAQASLGAVLWPPGGRLCWLPSTTTTNPYATEFHHAGPPLAENSGFGGVPPSAWVRCLQTGLGHESRQGSTDWWTVDRFGRVPQLQF
jgi:hypothetical protein